MSQKQFWTLIAWAGIFLAGQVVGWILVFVWLWWKGLA